MSYFDAAFGNIRVGGFSICGDYNIQTGDLEDAHPIDCRVRFPF